jgi:uncharacterized protein
MELYQYIIAIVGGAFAGAVNTLAGNGSAVTLTILTEVMGLPGNLANGTNRVGIFTQSFASTYAFYRHGRLHLRESMVYIVFTITGSIAGVITAVWVSSEQFLEVFRFLMVFMLFVILVKPKRWLRETEAVRHPNMWIAVPVFLILGFYGGFIQMGMGIFFLAAMVLGARFSLIDANAVKSFVVVAYTLLVLAIFQWKGLIDWKIGGIMAIGQTLGGYYTAKVASQYPKANVWAHRLLVLVVLIAIAKMFNVESWLFR